MTCRCVHSWLGTDFFKFKLWKCTGPPFEDTSIVQWVPGVSNCFLGLFFSIQFEPSCYFDISFDDYIYLGELIQFE